MKGYCFNCNKEVELKVSVKNCKINFRDKELVVKQKILHCKDCNSSMVDNSEIEDFNHKVLFEAYKKEEKLLLPEDIKKIRKKYHLSQEVFSRILGMGEKTITRYENGSLQTKVYDNLIRSVEDPEKLMFLIKKNKDCIFQSNNSKIKYQDLIKKISNIIEEYNKYENGNFTISICNASETVTSQYNFVSYVSTTVLLNKKMLEGQKESEFKSLFAKGFEYAK